VEVNSILGKEDDLVLILLPQRALEKPTPVDSQGAYVEEGLPLFQQSWHPRYDRVTSQGGIFLQLTSCTINYQKTKKWHWIEYKGHAHQIYAITTT